MLDRHQQKHLQLLQLQQLGRTQHQQRLHGMSPLLLLLLSWRAQPPLLLLLPDLAAAVWQAASSASQTSSLAQLHAPSDYPP
jgi:hypothetical protein